MDVPQSTLVADAIRLATRVLYLVRDGLAGLSSEVAAELRHVKEELHTLLDGCKADIPGPDLDYTSKIIAADLCTRLVYAESEHAYATQDTFALVWSKADLDLLSERILWLRDNSDRQSTQQEPNSRSLWTTGPNQQVSVNAQHVQSTSPDANPSHTSEDVDAALASKVKETLLNTDKAELIQDFLLEGLAFTSMHDREEEVSEAYRKTFQWIFETSESRQRSEHTRRAIPQHNFVSWLQSSDHGQVYWVNGKAGSGKSTLLRFIANHEQTRVRLRQWSDELPLVAIRFFFWTGGSVIQRSQDGLLRSLLHQLLDQRRDLIAWVFPQLWLECQDTKKRMKLLLSWEHSNLASTLRRALELASRDSKICLFIDGLDEFEGREDTVIGLVEDIVHVSPHVKACVSSRPWSAFEKAFKNVPQILVQDLTGTDMVQYMTDQLREGKRSRRCVQQMSEAEIQELQQAMLSRADGVFLWASLAMRSVLHNMSDDATFPDLLQQLQDLPSDLEDLFRHLLFQGRTADKLKPQSYLFQIKRARDDVCDFTGDDSVRSITLWQMLHSLDSKQERIYATIQQSDPQIAFSACTAFTNTLDDLCAGLLVLTSPEKLRSRIRDHSDSETRHLQASANRRVHYVHRTVRDFLVYSGVWSQLTQHTATTSFDPHISLLRSHVLRLRSPLVPPEKHRRLDEWWHDDIVLGMTHARFASAATAAEQVALLDQFNATLHWYWRPRGLKPDIQDTWARHAFGSYELREKRKLPFHHPFLSLAAKFGLAEYLHTKLKSSEFAYQGGIPLLSHTLEFLISRRKSVYPLTSIAVLQVLLTSGEDPNLEFVTMTGKNETPWLQAIKCLREAKRRGWLKSFDLEKENTSRWTAIVRMMLEYGADPKAVIEKDKWDPEVTVAGVVDDVAKTYLQAEVWNVKETLETGSE